MKFFVNIDLKSFVPYSRIIEENIIRCLPTCSSECSRPWVKARENMGLERRQEEQGSRRNEWAGSRQEVGGRQDQSIGQREDRGVEHNKVMYACFLVPKTGGKKWNYGVLLHNVTWSAEDNLGTFLLCDGTVMTFSLRMIREAVTRLTIKGDSQWSEFKKGFPYDQAKLKQVEFQLRKNGDTSKKEGDTYLQTLMDESFRKYRETARPVLPKPQKPVQHKSIYPTKTKTEIASPSGPQAEMKGLLTPTACGWVQGTLK
jgi:hypothetical protein